MNDATTQRALAPQRHEEILRRLEAEGAVFVADVARHFDVSQETVRRDLKALAARGQLDLTHGGATRLASVEPGLPARAVKNAEAKARIGARAAGLVNDGMVILLDAGTTTAAIASALTGGRGLTVVTTSLPIARELCQRDGFRVQMTGGTINPGDEAAEGPEVLDSLARLRVDMAFVSVGGVAPDGAVTDFTALGAATRRQMLLAAQRSYFVIDSSKFGALTPYRITDQARAAGIITDKTPSQPLLGKLGEAGLSLLLA